MNVAPLAVEFNVRVPCVMPYILFFSSYSLRSRTSFVLVVRKEAHVYLWHGCKSSSDSRKTAKVAAEKVQERYLFSMFILHVFLNIARCDCTDTDFVSVFSGEPKNHTQNTKQDIEMEVYILMQNSYSRQG